MIREQGGGGGESGVIRPVTGGRLQWSGVPADHNTRQQEQSHREDTHHHCLPHTGHSVHTASTTFYFFFSSIYLEVNHFCGYFINEVLKSTLYRLFYKSLIYYY